MPHMGRGTTVRLGSRSRLTAAVENLDVTHRAANGEEACCSPIRQDLHAPVAAVEYLVLVLISVRLHGDNGSTREWRRRPHLTPALFGQSCARHWSRCTLGLVFIIEMVQGDAVGPDCCPHVGKRSIDVVVHDTVNGLLVRLAEPQHCPVGAGAAGLPMIRRARDDHDTIYTVYTTYSLLISYY